MNETSSIRENVLDLRGTVPENWSVIDKLGKVWAVDPDLPLSLTAFLLGRGQLLGTPSAATGEMFDDVIRVLTDIFRRADASIEQTDVTSAFSGPEALKVIYFLALRAGLISPPEDENVTEKLQQLSPDATMIQSPTPASTRKKTKLAV